MALRDEPREEVLGAKEFERPPSVEAADELGYDRLSGPEAPAAAPALPTVKDRDVAKLPSDLGAEGRRRTQDSVAQRSAKPSLRGPHGTAVTSSVEEDRMPLGEAAASFAADAARPAVTSGVEIAIVSDNPRSAFDKTVKIANAVGWLPKQEMNRALVRSQDTNQPVGNVILFLADEEVGRLQRDLARAGLEQIVRRQEPLKQQYAARPARGKAAELDSSQRKREAGRRAQSLSNRVLLPQVQSFAEQQAVLNQVNQAAPSLNQVTLSFTTAKAARKATTRTLERTKMQESEAESSF